jgi:magnesium chelatase family protein
MDSVADIATLHIGYGPQVQEFCKPDKDAGALLKNAVDALGFSARSYGRILKVARTIADLEAEPTITATHVSEAIQYRNLDRYKNL